MKPDDRFRGIFRAQLLKDVAMANRINQLLKDSIHSDKFLVIAGNGHVMHYCGVPERVLQENPTIANETCLAVAHSSIAANFADDETLVQELEISYGSKGPGDYVFVYRNEEEDVKDETKKAYDKVGNTAHLPGNANKAKYIMQSMGYTDDQIEIAGQDAYNFQGVGNPHKHSSVQPGELVLDIGSGLGVDSFIASIQTGSDGNVVGVDISRKEVDHATVRAKERVFQNVEFVVADMEKLPFEDESFDVVISNGAFCLAPNKEKAFAEIFRVLKPGGPMSIFTSMTKVNQLDEGVSLY
jgi:2-polyprenyl-3-methyl-5-hydroxy-6-metoxy-1,4-benzoquinol methylase